MHCKANGKKNKVNKLYKKSTTEKAWQRRGDMEVKSEKPAFSFFLRKKRKFIFKSSKANY